MKRRPLLYIVLALVVSMAVSGCGIKPGSVSAPKGAENNGYPHTYPDIKLDPAPAALSH
jgi:uncharacterized protein YceK